MTLSTKIRDTLDAIREFIHPSYRPELYYMRGPGPACMRRHVAG